MLTLLETVAAIESLDTESDIIARACSRFLRNKRSEAKGGADPTEAASDMIFAELFHTGKVPAIDLMTGCMVVAAKIGAGVVRPEKTAPLIEQLLGLFNETFAEGLAVRVQKEGKKNPEDSFTFLRQILESRRDE